MKNINNYKKEIKARDEQAEIYEDWYLKRRRLYDWVEKKTIINTLGLKDSDVVLDAGCGTGRITRLIAKNVKKVYAIDFSPKSIDILNRKLYEEKIYNVETYVCSILDPLPILEKVDKIVSIQVIQHIHRNEINKALMNLYEQLKPGGVFVATVYNWNFYSKIKNCLKEGEFENGIYYFRFTPNELIELFKQNKFKQISVRGCVNLKGYNKIDKFYKMFYPLGKVDILLSKFYFSTLTGDFLIVKALK